MKSRIAFALALCVAALGCGSTPSETDRASAAQALGSCTLPSMYLVGSPRNFGVAPGGPLQMTCVGGAWQVDEMFAGSGNVFQAGAFKFVQTGDFSTGPSWGDNHPADGIADLGGDENDIVVSSPGTYTVRFEETTLSYTLTRKPSSCTQPSLFLRGTFNGWGKQDMFCVGPSQWAAIAMFIGGSETYKFDALGDWTTNWGDDQPDGVGDPNGANIQAPGSGRFLVTFDEGTLRYARRAVSPACAWPTMYVRGSFDGWQPYAMECENGHYAINLDGGTGGIDYKFDAFGDWSMNWGDDNGDFRADPNGANIRLFGKHHIHFYNDARYAYDTHQ
jgi:hypothetical protein